MGLIVIATTGSSAVILLGIAANASCTFVTLESKEVTASGFTTLDTTKYLPTSHMRLNYSTDIHSHTRTHTHQPVTINFFISVLITDQVKRTDQAYSNYSGVAGPFFYLVSHNHHLRE